MWVHRIAVLLAAVCVTVVLAGGEAAADILVTIDKASQRMSVAINGRTHYVWPVSTGRDGYGTPSGRFRPQWMARTYFSKKYYDSPMPHSIFFHHGYAIHGTEYIHRLGGPASHGCVRLHPRNAATLFALVQRHGMSQTRIVIGDSVALRRPERWSAQDRNEERFIGLMTDRLLLAEQIERKEALAKMEQMRASDALRRILARVPGIPAPEEPAVAIGVQGDQMANPEPVAQTNPPEKVTPPAQPQRRVERPLPRPRQPAATARPSRQPAKQQAAAPRKQPTLSASAQRKAIEQTRKYRVEQKPVRRPAQAEQRRPKVSWAPWWSTAQRQAATTRR